jgi:hypothetical protein
MREQKGMVRLNEAARLGALVLLASVASVPALHSRGSIDQDAAEPQAYLRSVARFSPGELARLDSGEAVAKVLDTERREVALVGAIRVKAPSERLLDYYRDISRLRRSEVFIEVGTFGAPPQPDDLRGLTLEDYDLETIRGCRPGDCGVRLPAADMVRLQREVDWRAPDWRQRAGALWKGLLADYVAGYLARGDAGLAQYHNKEVPLRVAEEFNLLFGRSAHFKAAAPAFFDYAENFPTVPLPGAESLFYWTKQDFGLRPVFSMTHLALYAPPRTAVPRPLLALVASKQIYATHYFDAALGLSFAFDDGESGFYLLCVNRARTRSLMSFFRGFARSVVLDRSHEAMGKMLRTIKMDLEKPSGGT